MISLRCPDCGRQVSFVRIKTGEGVCQTCGRILTPLEVKSQREAQIQTIKQASSDNS